MWDRSSHPKLKLRKVKGVVPASLASRVIRRVRHGVSVLTSKARPPKTPGLYARWVFPKIGGVLPPKSSILIGYFHDKPSILGCFPSIFGTHVSKGSNLWLCNQRFDKLPLPKPTLSVICVLMSYFDSGFWRLFFVAGTLVDGSITVAKQSSNRSFS